MKKQLLVLAAIAVVFQSQTMHRDPRVGPQMVQMGIDENYTGCSMPSIQSNGKKIYYCKAWVNGIDHLVTVRYHANDTLDTSYGQNGIKIGEIVGRNIPILQAINNSLKDLSN